MQQKEEALKNESQKAEGKETDVRQNTYFKTYKT